ncbi:Centrosomal protein of 85 kDa [Bagarius yarrelli]|uniref:Centrosomal protein of 85 kDa n=1 Tax=Bagarius yarrelli TaxID=175774 RepID=A0A556VW71_BAGYA|nr:Centrosomal protein of 85 kDa [Bagarius yarrelli]
MTTSPRYHRAPELAAGKNPHTLHPHPSDLSHCPVSQRGGLWVTSFCSCLCVSVGTLDMEFQTPAVSEKFQSRFGWRPHRAESETGPGAKTADSTEELCSSSSSPSFQPIRSQIPIPTAHVMPSTAHSPLQRPSVSRSTSSTSKSSLCKSASSPNLEAQDGGGVKQDCLSRYRSLVNGLDHSLFPGADHNHSRLDEGQGFETPPVEPTLNQSTLLGGFGPDIRMNLHMTTLGDATEYRSHAFHAALDQTYKVLPEARTGISPSSESYGKTKTHQTENMAADWQQKFESLRMQVEQIQEAQRENTFLRAQFAERTDALSQEKLEAERRLGTVEAETQRLSDSLKESGEKHAEELKKQEERLDAAEQKVEDLQGFVEDLEVQLKEVRAANRAKEEQLEEQKHRERELLATVTGLQARVQEGLEDGVRLPCLDVEKLRQENLTLKEEQQKLKKVIEKQLKMMEQLGTQIRSVQQQLSEEESNSQTLRDEMNSKDQQLLQLRSAVKEVSTHNQELMEQSVCLRERLETESSVCDVRLTQQLLTEMALCLTDLRSLCSVLTHTAHGQDPNLSMLLGISAPAVSAPCDDWLNPAVLQNKLQEALQLRRDVEELRNTVSDRYAQDMGENCTTQ